MHYLFVRDGKAYFQSYWPSKTEVQGRTSGLRKETARRIEGVAPLGQRETLRT